jgi:hypothetical protein
LSGEKVRVLFRIGELRFQHLGAVRRLEEGGEVGDAEEIDAARRS